MMTSLTGAMNFAHLAGLTRISAKKAKGKEKPVARDGDDAEGDTDETENDSAQRSQRADDEDGDDSEMSKGKKGKRAKSNRKDDLGDENNGDEGDREDDEENDDEGDDESDEDEMRGKKGKRAAAIRNRERARCAAIFASKAAGDNPALAAHLAFCTRMTRTEAIGALKAAPAAAASSLHARMATVNTPRVGGAESGGRTSAQAIASAWDTAMAPYVQKR